MRTGAFRSGLQNTRFGGTPGMIRSPWPDLLPTWVPHGKACMAQAVKKSNGVRAAGCRLPSLDALVAKHSGSAGGTSVGARLASICHRSLLICFEVIRTDAAHNAGFYLGAWEDSQHLFDADGRLSSRSDQFCLLQTEMHTHEARSL